MNHDGVYYLAFDDDLEYDVILEFKYDKEVGMYRILNKRGKLLGYINKHGMIYQMKLGGMVRLR